MLRWMIEWLLTPRSLSAKVWRAVIVTLILPAIFYSRYVDHLEAVR